MRWLLGSFVLMLSSASFALADGPKDNQIDNVRKIPPPGVDVAPADREELEAGLAALAKQLEQLRTATKNDPRRGALVPDVEVFHRAVRMALEHQEFFAPGDVPKAKALLKLGHQRADQLAAGDAPWTRATGLVVRGFVSKLDGTVQPYGLVIPASYRAEGERRHRLDLWFHGRGETLSEVNFLDQRLKQAGPIQPADTIVLHPYGRYSNAFKLAGEVDVFEALEHAERHYRVDDDRIVVRGFSMGGAGAWHMAVHHPDRWVAAQPGAGFSETPAFLRSFQSETLTPSWHEERLWRLYDCTDWVSNLRLVPTVAYSGALDVQKQAADIMAEAALRQGMTLTHLIGPETKHALHAGTLQEIERRLASIVERGRDRTPRRVQFTTYTLRYPRAHWLRIERLAEHWQPAEVDATLIDVSQLRVRTKNVAALTFDLPPGEAPWPIDRPVTIAIDHATLVGPTPGTDRSWQAAVHRVDGVWQMGPAPASGLVKRPGLQGPIDDAFLDAFVFVRPTGKPQHAAIGRWVEQELDHAITHWRQQMRGTARVVNDTDLDAATIAGANLVLWGDPASNRVLGQIAEKLPLTWSAEDVVVGKQRFAAEHHVPVLVYPNPLNPERYVVLNSSFTYREYDYLNNARQVPKLPDWAVVDVRGPVTSRLPGTIAGAAFFDEQWRVGAGR